MCEGIGIGYTSLASAVEVSLLLHPPPVEALEALATLELPLSVPAPAPLSPPLSSSSSSLLLEGGRTTEMTAGALCVLAASIAAKEALFRKTLACGQVANSAVRPDAWRCICSHRHSLPHIT